MVFADAVLFVDTQAESVRSKSTKEMFRMLKAETADKGQNGWQISQNADSHRVKIMELVRLTIGYRDSGPKYFHHSLVYN